MSVPGHHLDLQRRISVLNTSLANPASPDKCNYETGDYNTKTTMMHSLATEDPIQSFSTLPGDATARDNLI